MLTLDQSVIVLHQLLHLLHGADPAELVVFIVCLGRGVFRGCTSVGLFEYGHLSNFFIDSCHKLSQPSEVGPELLDQFATTLIKAGVEKFFADCLDLMGYCLFGFWWDFGGLPVLCLEALGEDVVLERDDFHHLSLKHHQAVAQVVVFFSHVVQSILIVCGYHEVEVRLTTNLAEFVLKIGFSRAKELASLWLPTGLVFVSECFLLQSLLQPRDL